jgi:uncharacterized protein (DUF58 family)
LSSDVVETIPLFPRRRLVGSVFGGYTSIRRGEGSDVASSRPYQPGDHFRTIDWKSSARLSSARGSDEFVVRERHSEEMPRVVVVVDRRPEMALYPDDLPWLSKPAAVAAAAELIVVSALNQRGLVGYLDYASHDGEGGGSAFWRPPRAQSSVWHGTLEEVTANYLAGGYDAPDDNLEQALEFLSIVRSSVPTGSFVFVLSDFTAPPSAEAWTHAVDHGWDVVPVIVQDPVWEQSFPPLGGVLAPLADARGGRLRYVRLNAREADARRQANESRLGELRSQFLRLGLDTVLLSDSEPGAVRGRFLEWAEGRLELRGQRW